MTAIPLSYSYGRVISPSRFCECWWPIWYGMARFGLRMQDAVVPNARHHQRGYSRRIVFVSCLLTAEACCCSLQRRGGGGSKASALIKYPTCITLHYVTEVLSGPFLLLPRLAPTPGMACKGGNTEKETHVGALYPLYFCIQCTWYLASCLF